MPLVLICGQPCSGKSKVAERLCSHLRGLGIEVVVICEESIGLERNSAYEDATCEKRTRGLLKSAVDRNLREKRVLILDSLNSIKGYRYELWCLAKAAATRYCVVHCEIPLEVSRQWNSTRTGPTYSEEVFNDLCGRFEPPDTRNRWDTPLLRVDPRLDDLLSALNPTVTVITGQASSGNSKAPQPIALTPNLATKNPELSTTNLLNELDRAAQEVVHAVIEAQSQVAGEAIGVLELQGTGKRLRLSRPVTLPELRRQKRAFLRLATQNNWIRLRESGEAQGVFAEFLQQNLDVDR